MKVWLGVIGRAFIEFIIILALISFAAGAAMFVGLPTGGIRAIYSNAASAALKLIPLSASLTLFLAFFSFELRLRNRAIGWLGLVILGLLLFSCGLGMRRVPAFREAAALRSDQAEGPVRLIPAALAQQQGRVALWIGGFEGGEASDSVAVDFGTDYPRLAYSPRAEIDQATGEMDIQGRSYRAALPPGHPRVQARAIRIRVVPAAVQPASRSRANARSSAALAAAPSFSETYATTRSP